MDRADLRGELLRREIEDLGAHQIGWHQIRRALHSLERSGHGSRQRLRGRGLGQTRYGFDENMSACHQRGDQRFTQVVLSN